MLSTSLLEYPNWLLQILKKLYPLFPKRVSKGPKCEIIGQEFDENSNEIQFKIGKHGSKKLITLTAKHFAFNKNLLTQLTQEDAYLVGFTVASELAARERKSMLALKINAGC